MKKFSFYAFLIILSLIFLAKQNEEVDESIINRLNACTRIASIMIKEDKDFLDVITKKAFTKFRDEKYDDIYLQVRENTVLGCFKTVSLIKTAELLNVKDNKINPFTKENKALLSLTTLFDLYLDSSEERVYSSLKNKEKYTKDLNLLKKYYEKAENSAAYDQKLIAYLDLKTSKNQKAGSVYTKFVSDTKQEQYNQERTEGHSEYLDESEYSNLNLNLFGFNLNDPKIKNGLGLSLLIIVVLGLVWSYKIVTYKEEKPKKKKRN